MFSLKPMIHESPVHHLSTVGPKMATGTDPLQAHAQAERSASSSIPSDVKEECAWKVKDLATVSCFCCRNWHNLDRRSRSLAVGRIFGRGGGDQTCAVKHPTIHINFRELIHHKSCVVAISAIAVESKSTNHLHPNDVCAARKTLPTWSSYMQTHDAVIILVCLKHWPSKKNRQRNYASKM